MSPNDKQTLLRTIYSAYLAETSWEAMEAVYEGAKKLGINVPESIESKEDFLAWMKREGIKSGIWADGR